MVPLTVLAACGANPPNAGKSPPPLPEDRLTAQQLGYARDVIAHDRELARSEITSATVVRRPGRITNANVGGPCLSGQLLQIKVIGRFPHVLTSGGPPMTSSHPRDMTVTAILLTADAETGRLCQEGVQVGPVHPAPGSQPVVPGPPHITAAQVHRMSRADQLRGPHDSPPVSAADAIKFARGGASLGLWQMPAAEVSHPTRAWAIARVRFYSDINVLSFGGPVGAPRRNPRPGWARFVTFVDATTGKVVETDSF